jgi:glucose-fructose oxidoreductase
MAFEQLACDGGTPVQLALSNAEADMVLHLQVIGTRGCLTLQAGYQGLQVSGPSGTPYLDNGLSPQVYGRRGGALAGERDHFLTCIREGRTPLVSVNDGLAAMRIATAVQQAADTYQVLQLDGHHV